MEALEGTLIHTLLDVDGKRVAVKLRQAGEHSSEELTLEG